MKTGASVIKALMEKSVSKLTEKRQSRLESQLVHAIARFKLGRGD